MGKFVIRVTADPEGRVVDEDRSNNERQGVAGWFTSSLDGIDLTRPV